LPTVVGVKLRFTPKTLWFDPVGARPMEGESVVVETERGMELGVVTETPHDVAASELPAPLKPVARVASEQDLERAEELRAQERAALSRYRELVKSHSLDMKPIDVEYLFGGDKIVFYFSSEERVDFRELVRELANEYKARIDMRQIGVRDEARLVGGVGHCGQQLCCARLGSEFQPVSIRMAKEQDLPLNPLKISGLCGRLMCCLRYEYDAYKDFKTRAPKRGALVDTPLGAGKVSDLNTPKETVSIRLEGGTSFTVPLGSMSCSKGTGCPCSVSRETLEETGKLSVALAAADRESEVMPFAPAQKPRRQAQAGEPQQAQPAASEGKPAQGKAAAKAGGPGGKPKQKAPSEATPETSGQAPKSTGGRRRRRRRPQGGGGPKVDGGGAS